MPEPRVGPDPGASPAFGLPNFWLAILEHAPLPMAALEGADHVVRYANPAFVRLLGMSRAAIVGKPFRELLADGADCVSFLDRVYRTGAPAHHTEQQHSRADRAFWSFTMWPTLAGDGPAGVMLQVSETPPLQEATIAMNEALILGSLQQQELTDAADESNAKLQEEMLVRRRAEDALRESEERYRALFGSVPVAVVVCDRNGLIQSYNRRAAELWGRDPRRGDSADRYGALTRLREPTGTFPADAQSPMVGVLRTGVPALNLEMLIERPGGSLLPVIVNFAALKNAGGEITGTITSFDDITERKAAEALLREADDRKNEFLAMLAHELRNPLAPIRFALEIVKRSDGNVELAGPALSTMERQLGHMTRLVEDLLDVGRISQGKLELRRGTIELASILHPLVEAARPACEAARQELTLALPSRPVHLLGDPVRLAQVFGNLLNNACKFTPPGGRISLVAERHGENVVVRVRDTGVGIDPRMLTHIFDIFTQGDQTLERSQGGLGIGLTLVRQLVEMHGGTVEAFSDGPDHGSEFVVRLPAIGEVPKPPTPIVPLGAAGGLTPRRILVVDDNHDTADSLTMLLKLTGHETKTAFDGLEAVEAARSFKPDVVLLDIGLPKLNGYEAARRIREQAWSPALVLVALTGWGQDEDREKTAQAGFDGHLVKPVDFDALVKLLAGFPVAGPPS